MASPEQRRVVERIGSCRLTLTYSGRRLVSAEGKGRTYWARLSLDHKVPSGSLANSYGDLIRWRDGIEESDACVGGFELHNTEKIPFDRWVSRMLELIRAGLDHDGTRKQSSRRSTRSRRNSD